MVSARGAGGGGRGNRGRSPQDCAGRPRGPQAERGGALRRLGWTAYLLARAAREPADRRRSADAIARLRDRRARAIARFAAERVPWYRDAMAAAGLSPADVRTADDLARLPVLEPGELAARPDDLVPRGASRDDWVELRTSGTSGTPRTIWHDPASALATLAAGLRESTLARRFLGRMTGYRTATLAVEGDTHVRTVEALERLVLQPRRLLPLRRTFPALAPLPDLAARLDDFAPDLLHGYGSTIGRLFRHVHATGAPFHRPRLVTYTSDALAPEERRLIEETFGVPVLALYRATEAIVLGFECGEGRGIHVNEDLFHVRIVDAEGRTASPGETGSVILSNLVNRGTVLLNYRLGDLAAAVPEPCACDRPLPRIELREGRDFDWIDLPSGQRLHPFALTSAFHEEVVWRWQIVQPDPATLLVRAVPRDEIDRPAWAARLGEEFRRILGPGVAVDVEFVDAIPPSAAGKVRVLAHD